MPLAAEQMLRHVLRPIVHAAREAPVWAGMAASRKATGPSVALMPAYGPEGAALLRIYNLAAPLRALGWRVHVIPWRLHLSQRRRILNALRPDVVLMQGVRHALNRPALYPGHTIVLDIDDADFHLDHLATPLREAIPGVHAVIAGSRYVADWCAAAGAARVEVVWTGAPASTRHRPPHSVRPPVVAWAQSRPETYTGEAARVLSVMSRVTVACPEVRLRLYDLRPGQDGGFLAPFRNAGIVVEWVPSMTYPDYLASFDDVAVGLSPIAGETPFSRGKSFGKVLGYLDRKVPVVASDAAEHGVFFSQATGVISDDQAFWVAEITSLLRDAARRQHMADAAHGAFRARLSPEEAATRIDSLLSSLGGNGSKAAA